MKCNSSYLALLVGSLLATTTSAQAMDFSITANLTGNATTAGYNFGDPFPTTGAPGLDTFRGFMRFDLSGVPNTILSARVVMPASGRYGGIDQQRTISLMQYGGNPLISPELNSNLYNDLGSTSALASATLFLPDERAKTPEVVFQLGSDGVMSLNFSVDLGEQVIFGLLMEGIPDQNSSFSEYAWQGDGDPYLSPTLELKLVPEINGSGFAYISFILGALGLWLYSGAGRARPEEMPSAA